MMYGIFELQEVYSLWKKDQGKSIEKFAVSFSYYEQKKPLIFVGLSSVVKYLGQKIFKDEEIFYLHSLQQKSGKLLFSDQFIRYLSLLRFELELHAPREGVIFYPGEPVMKVVGDVLILAFFKKILNHYLPRQIQICTEVEKIASYISPSFLTVENSSSSYVQENALDVRSAYIGGAVATEDLSAAVTYNIPMCYHRIDPLLVFLDVKDPLFTKKLSSVRPEQKIFLKGRVTKEFLEDFPFYAAELKGVSINLLEFSETLITTRFHYYRKSDILDEDFQLYRFVHKGLIIGDILTGATQINKKKTFFGKYLATISQEEILHDVTTYADEPAALTRGRALRSMQQLPCKFRGEERGGDYPVRIIRKESDQENCESLSNTSSA